MQASKAAMTQTRASAPIMDIARLVRTIADWLGRIAIVVAPPILRIALAVPFFRSGLTRWDGFLSLSPSAAYLFEEEFKLHIFGGAYDFPAPIVVAHIVGVAEITLPILLVLGLGTRFVALGLLMMTGVIQLVAPDGWANFHLPWAGLSLGIIALGPGRLSLDFLIGRLWLAYETLLGAD
jgi:putative oxidoreductase